MVIMDYHSTVNQCFGAIYLLLGILALVTNTIILVVLIYMKKRAVINIIITNFALIDIVKSLCALYMGASIIMTDINLMSASRGRMPVGDGPTYNIVTQIALIQTATLILHFSSISSVFNLMLTVMNEYIFIKHHFFYKKQINSVRAAGVIMLTWACSAAFTAARSRNHTFQTSVHILNRSDLPNGMPATPWKDGKYLVRYRTYEGIGQIINTDNRNFWIVAEDTYSLGLLASLIVCIIIIFAVYVNLYRLIRRSIHFTRASSVAGSRTSAITNDDRGNTFRRPTFFGSKVMSTAFRSPSRRANNVVVSDIPNNIREKTKVEVDEPMLGSAQDRQKPETSGADRRQPLKKGQMSLIMELLLATANMSLIGRKDIEDKLTINHIDSADSEAGYSTLDEDCELPPLCSQTNPLLLKTQNLSMSLRDKFRFRERRQKSFQEETDLEKVDEYGDSAAEQDPCCSTTKHQTDNFCMLEKPESSKISNSSRNNDNNSINNENNHSIDYESTRNKINSRNDTGGSNISIDNNNGNITTNSNRIIHNIKIVHKPNSTKTSLQSQRKLIGSENNVAEIGDAGIKSASTASNYFRRPHTGFRHHSLSTVVESNASVLVTSPRLQPPKRQACFQYRTTSIPSSRKIYNPETVTLYVEESSSSTDSHTMNPSSKLLNQLLAPVAADKSLIPDALTQINTVADGARTVERNPFPKRPHSMSTSALLPIPLSPAILRACQREKVKERQPMGEFRRTENRVGSAQFLSPMMLHQQQAHQQRVRLRTQSIATARSMNSLRNRYNYIKVIIIVFILYVSHLLLYFIIQLMHVINLVHRHSVEDIQVYYIVQFILRLILTCQAVLNPIIFLRIRTLRSGFVALTHRISKSVRNCLPGDLGNGRASFYD